MQDNSNKDLPQTSTTATQQPSKLMSCKMIPSKRLRAKPWLADEENYTYRRRRQSPQTGMISFMCAERMEECCRATAVYDPVVDKIHHFTFQHNHPSNSQKVRAMLEEVFEVNHMVNSCASQSLTPNNVLAKVLRNLEFSNNANALPFVASKECLHSWTQRAKIKAKVSIPDKVPTTFEGLLQQGIQKVYTHLKAGVEFHR